MTARPCPHCRQVVNPLCQACGGTGFLDPVQRPSCDRCEQGTMDADRYDTNGRLVSAGNDHVYGRCGCPCHERSPR